MLEKKYLTMHVGYETQTRNCQFSSIRPGTMVMEYATI